MFFKKKPVSLDPFSDYLRYYLHDKHYANKLPKLPPGYFWSFAPGLGLFMMCYENHKLALGHISLRQLRDQSQRELDHRASNIIREFVHMAKYWDWPYP